MNLWNQYKAAVQREIEGTLQRLGTDYLDLYIIHRFDYETPIEETMEALHNLVQAGKVRAIGASAMYGYQFHNMQYVAEKADECIPYAIQPAGWRSSGPQYLAVWYIAGKDWYSSTWQVW